MTRAALLPALVCVACVAPAPAATLPEAAPPASKVEPPSRACAWPNGARAAVSLTYDDALGSQLEHAVPVLERYQLRATFFLSGPNIERFAPLAKSGHELASHTLTHPCNAALAALDMTQMASELDAGIGALQALGVSGKLTFAYPCGQTRVKGMESYVPLVQERFRAARGVAGVVADPASLDPFNVPALFPPQGSDGKDVLAFIERAEQTGGWAVIGVHGVSEQGEYLQLPQAAHDSVLAYLAEQRARVWTAPFGAVADAALACRQSATGK